MEQSANAASSVAGPTAGNPAIERLGACIATQHQADLLLMIDTSGSLGHAVDGQPATDPTAVRVTAAQYLLDQLSQYSADVKLDVALAGFDVDFHPSTTWVPLTAGNLPSLDANVQSYASQDNGIDTDYTNAFVGALGMLRSHNLGGNRCQAILWFTDGEQSIQPRQTSYQRQFGTSKPYAPGVDISTPAGANRAASEGQAALCQPGGTIDQVRAANIITLAVGLGVSDHDFSLMKSVATGSAPNGTRCGTTSPNIAVGSFTLARSVDDILFAFDAFADPNDLPSQTEQAICQVRQCSAARNFVLDSSIRLVHVLADTTKPGVEIFLTPPGSRSAVVVTSRSTQVSSKAIPGLDGTWINDHIVDLNLAQKPGERWDGKWSVVFVDPNGSTPGELAKTSIRIVGDLVPTLLDGPSLEFRSGKKLTAHLGVIEDVTHQPVTHVLGTALLTARLVPASGPDIGIVSQIPIDQLAAGTPIDLSSVPPGAATIDLVLNVTTKSPDPGVPGTALSPQVAQIPVDVLPPLQFPTVGTYLDFGHASGTAPLHANLAVAGPGCVWVNGGSISASPVDVKDVAVRVSGATGSAPASCLRLGVGQHASIPMTLRLSRSGTGVVAGTLTAHLSSVGADSEAITEPVKFIGDVVKPANGVTLWSTFALALLLGLAVPVVFLYLARWRAARIPAGGVLVADVPIEVSDVDVTRKGLPLVITDHDCEYVPVSRASRQLSPLPGVSVRTRMPVDPVGAGYAAVSAPGFSVVTAGGDGRLPSAVRGSWMVLLAEPDRQQARLVLILAANSTPEAFSRMAAQVRRSAPSLVSAARRAAASGTTPGASGPSDESGTLGFDDVLSPGSGFGATAVNAGGSNAGFEDWVRPASSSAPARTGESESSQPDSDTRGWS
jgi:hypothetical protein